MDISLNYVERGEGFPFILLHGNGNDVSIFEYQLADFSSMFRVIAIDTRGHGQSPRGTKPFRIRQFVEDLKDFMDEHGIEKANILGFSDGGNIALIFAIKYPERVNQMVISGANLDASGVHSAAQRSIVRDYYFTKLFAWRSAAAKLEHELLGLMVKDPNIKVSDLKRIQAPTLVLCGTEDLIKREHSEMIAANIPNAIVQFIPGGHGVVHHTPAEFDEVVWQFLKEP